MSQNPPEQSGTAGGDGDRRITPPPPAPPFPPASQPGAPPPPGSGAGWDPGAGWNPGAGWQPPSAGQGWGGGGMPPPPPPPPPGWQANTDYQSSGARIDPVTNLRLAGWWYRVGATVIDGLLIGVVGGIVQATAGTAGGWVAEVVLQAVYTVLLLGQPKGQTIGNMAVGTRVVDARTGAPVTYGTAFLRWLIQFLLSILIIPGIVDDLFPLWDGRRQTLHDKVANTVVVMAR